MSDQTIHWKRLRLKGNTTDPDTDWRGTQVSPHRVTVAVGGSASNGVYSVTITGHVVTLRGAQVRVQETISMTRVAQTNAQIAAALETNADANVDLVGAGIAASSNSTDLFLDFPPGSFVTITTSAPGSGTLTASEPSLPILASAPHFAGSRNDVGKVVVMVLAKDDAGATLLAPGTGTQTTVDVQIVEVAVVKDISSSGVASYRQVIGGSVVLADQNLCVPIELPVRGAGYFTVRLLNFADAVANTDSYEIIWREGGQ